MLKLPRRTPYYRPRPSDRLTVPLSHGTENIADKRLTVTDQVTITPEQRAAARAYLERHDALDLAAVLDLEDIS